MSKAAKALKATASQKPTEPPVKTGKVNVPKSVTKPIAPSTTVAERLASVNKELHQEHKPTMAEQKVLDSPSKITPPPSHVVTPPPIQDTSNRQAYRHPPVQKVQQSEYHVSTTGVQMQPYPPEVKDDKGETVRPSQPPFTYSMTVGTGGMRVKNL